MTIPDKPTSSNQKYVLTDKGVKLLSENVWWKSSESNHRRKVGSDTPAACANSDLSFDSLFERSFILKDYFTAFGIGTDADLIHR